MRFRPTSYLKFWLSVPVVLSVAHGVGRSAPATQKVETAPTPDDAHSVVRTACGSGRALLSSATELCRVKNFAATPPSQKPERKRGQRYLQGPRKFGVRWQSRFIGRYRFGSFVW